MMKRIVLHPFLLAIYFILILFANNINSFSLEVTFIPTVLTCLFVLLLWVLLRIILKDGDKAGLIAFLFVLLSFPYGHLYNFFAKYDFIKWHIGANYFLFLFFVIPIFIAGYLIIRSKRSFDDLIKRLNISAIFLVCFPLFKIGTFYLNKKDISNKDILEEKYKNYTMGVHPNDSINLDKLPNIYYIVLDAYGREDILREMYNYNNSGFLGYLRKKGFFVADKSRSNYPQTWLSLSSTLNFDYIDNLIEKIDKNSCSFHPLIKLLNHNKVFKILEQFGYEIVFFPSLGLELEKLDKSSNVTRMQSKEKIFSFVPWTLDEFQISLFNTTILKKITDHFFGYLIFDLYRKKILFTLSNVGKVSDLKRPVFVFAHLLSPHPPFVFGASGEEKTPRWSFKLSDASQFFEYNQGSTKNDYIRGYRDQVAFINSRIQEMIEMIQKNVTRKSIIILQGDHGPGSMYSSSSLEDSNLEERFSIFNAYYLPDDGKKWLYNDITPVNTFRLIFKQYFGMHLVLLEDKSYYSKFTLPYDLKRVY